MSEHRFFGCGTALVTPFASGLIVGEALLGLIVPVLLYLGLLA